ncbi:MAG: GGDEF domain-containing protein [Polyangiaceae bacterium]|nr:GGDEF domain-containing protein [Polyangiaceae bacterium]
MYAPIRHWEGFRSSFVLQAVRQIRPPAPVGSLAPNGFCKRGGINVSDFDDKTRVTQVLENPVSEQVPTTDCLVVIYSQEPGMLGKRFVLDKEPVGVGRGADCDIVLEGDSVSRRHAYFTRRGANWFVADANSTNGTYLNEEQLEGERMLTNADRVKIGPSILKFLSGADAEAKYHEEIYRMTIVDGLTQVHNKRYFFEALEREIVRARRHERSLSVLIFDIDLFKNVNDQFGHLAGDYALRELARLVQDRIRRDEVFARYGGEEFVILLPETPLEGATALAESLRSRVEAHPFVFQNESMPLTISIGCAELTEQKTAEELIGLADQKLYEAKRSGRNRVCY